MMSFLRLEFRLYLLEGEKKDLCLFFFVCNIGLRMAIFHVANGSVHSDVLCFIERERVGLQLCTRFLHMLGFHSAPFPQYMHMCIPPIPPASRKSKTVRGNPLLFLIPTDH